MAIFMGQAAVSNTGSSMCVLMLPSVHVCGSTSFLDCKCGAVKTEWSLSTSGGTVAREGALFAMVAVYFLCLLMM